MGYQCLDQNEVCAILDIELPKALAEGVITQEQFEVFRSLRPEDAAEVLEELTQRRIIKDILTKFLADGVITQAQFDELSHPGWNAEWALGELENLKEVQTELPKALAEGLITQERFDELSDFKLINPKWVLEKLRRMRIEKAAEIGE